MGLRVITGPMFSGKTEYLISLMNRELIARRKVQFFVPERDNRHGRGVVKSNGGVTITGVIPAVVKTAFEIHQKVKHLTDLVCIDEAQFFEEDIVHRVCLLISGGFNVAVSGLNLTASGEAFGSMPMLMAMATEPIVQCQAVCTAEDPRSGLCGKPATRTWRSPNAGKEKIVIGGSEIYQARCLSCWSK